MKLLYNPDAEQAVNAWLDCVGSITSWGPACVLWLVGPSGIGKASLIKHWATEHDWELSVISADTHHNAKEVIDQMGKICNTQSFASAFEGKTPKRAILIDDLDIFASADRGFFGGFVDCFKYIHWKAAPCICIVTEQLEKRVQDLKKGIVIKMPAPSDTAIAKWHTKPESKVSLSSMIKECNGNMSYLKLLEGSGIPSQVMDRAFGAQCMFDYPPLSEPILRRVIMEDPWFHPLRYHENALTEISKRKGSVASKLAVYKTTIETLIAWDALIGPSGGLSDATEIATELIVCAIRLFLGKMKCTTKTQESNGPLPFTKMLSHLSLQKKHRREQYDNTPFGFPCPFFL